MSPPSSSDPDRKCARAVAKEKARADAERARDERQKWKRELRRLRHKPRIRLAEDDAGWKLISPFPRWLPWMLAIDLGASLAGLYAALEDGEPILAGMVVVVGSLVGYMMGSWVVLVRTPGTVCVLRDGRVILLLWTRRVIAMGRVEKLSYSVSRDLTGLATVYFHGADGPAVFDLPGLGEADLDRVGDFCRSAGIEKCETK